LGVWGGGGVLWVLFSDGPLFFSTRPGGAGGAMPATSFPPPVIFSFHAPLVSGFSSGLAPCPHQQGAPKALHPSPLPLFPPPLSFSVTFFPNFSGAGAELGRAPTGVLTLIPFPALPHLLGFFFSRAPSHSPWVRPTGFFEPLWDFLDFLICPPMIVFTSYFYVPTSLFPVRGVPLNPCLHKDRSTPQGRCKIVCPESPFPTSPPPFLPIS